MGGQHRHDQGAVEKPGDLRRLNALAPQKLDRPREIVAQFGGTTLPVFGQIGEH